MNVENGLRLIGEARREVGRQMRKPTGREQRAEELIERHLTDLVPAIDEDSESYWHIVSDVAGQLEDAETDVIVRYRAMLEAARK